jgi:hypothetical protein
MSPAASSVEPRARGAQRQALCEAHNTRFSWSIVKIRFAAFFLLGAATPAVNGIAVAGSLVKWLSLVWRLGIALLMHLLGQRATSEATVLTIDARGIVDRRLMAKRIAWQEIEAICPGDIDRSHVVDLKLRWPEISPAERGAQCDRKASEVGTSNGRQSRPSVSGSNRNDPVTYGTAAACSASY